MDSILAAAGGKGKVSQPAATKVPSEQRPRPERKPKVTPSSSAKPSTASNVVTPKAMEILSEEIGVPTEDLIDERLFSEMGVDSLMALTISGKFREALGVEMSSSMFMDYPAVKDLKRFLGSTESASNESARIPDSSSSEGSPSRLASPAAEIDSASSVTDSEGSQPLECGDSSMITFIRATIAEETGVSLDDIDGSTSLASLGLDSLMSLTISGKIRENTGHELPSEFFAENTTMDSIEGSLGIDKKPALESGDSGKGNARQVIMSPDASEDETHPKADVSNSSSIPPASKRTSETETASSPVPIATSILLQGLPTSPRSLFLLPDGSGSATSYSLLPPLSSTNNLAVFALNSPFLKTPKSYPPSIPTLVSHFLAEIRRRQPHGPYSLAGWSAGGVCAYEACLQLLSSGEAVERLILIDAPCPLDLGRLPSYLHTFFDEHGLLGPGPNGNNTNGASTTPDWLIPHFDASIAALSAYRPGILLPEEKNKKLPTVTRTHAIWAKDGVCKFPTDARPKMGKGQEEEQDEEPKGMSWLLDNREGPQLRFNGWEALLGDDAIAETAVVQGANHFTLMREGNVEMVGEFLRGAME